MRTNIGNLGCVVACQKHVGALKVQMYDALGMQEAHAVRDVKGNLPSPAQYSVDQPQNVRTRINAQRAALFCCFFLFLNITKKNLNS